MATENRDQQIKNLGIDSNLLYEIGGTLDNLESLQFFLSNEIEDIQRGLERTQDCWLKTRIKHIMQLTFVISNEHKNCLNDLEKLRLQLEGE